MVKNKLLKIIFLDVPIVKGFLQNPIWLLWFNFSVLTILSALLVVVIYFSNADSLIDLESLSIATEVVVLTQPFLALNFGKINLDAFDSPNVRFIILFFIGVFFLDYLTNWRDFIYLSNKGFSNNLRFSFLSSEPSYFAETALILFFLIFKDSKVKSLIFISIIFLLTRSYTLIQGISIFITIYLLMETIFYDKILVIKKHQIFTLLCIYFFLMFTILNTDFLKDFSLYLQEKRNSWRLSSNVLAIQNSNFLPNSNWRSDIINLFNKNNTWGKSAVFSLIPYISLRFGTIFLTLYIITLNYFISSTIIVRKLTALQITIILYSVLHVLILSPKYNPSILLLIPFYLAFSSNKVLNESEM